MNRNRVLLAACCFVLAAVCVWTACELTSQDVIPSRSQLAATSEGVILNGEIEPPYPADNWWNTDISSAPVDNNSSVYIAWIGRGCQLHPDWGVYYGIPFMGINSQTPSVEVDIYAYPDESDPGPYPVPTEATYDWRYVGKPPDSHCLMYNRDTRILYELFCAEWTGTEWRANSGAIFDTKVNYRRPEGWTSADAAGLEIMPGLVKWSETNTGDGTPICHAHRFTLRSTNGRVFPANHAAGTTSGALPMGARLRLRNSFDTSGYALPVQRLLESLKRYGLILADNGSDMYIQGTQDERWGDMSMWVDALNDITAGDFEVIELGWTPEIGTGVKE